MPAALSGVRGEVRFDDVRFCYKPDEPLLEYLSLTMDGGRIVEQGSHAELLAARVASGQSCKCYSELVPMSVFLERFITEGGRTRIHEPPNAYNAEDPGIRIVAALIDAAVGG